MDQMFRVLENLPPRKVKLKRIELTNFVNDAIKWKSGEAMTLVLIFKGQLLDL